MSIDALFGFDDENENSLIELLQKCDDFYNNSDDLYTLNEEDINLLKDSLNYDISGIVTDDIYDEIYFKVKSIYSNNPYFNKIGSNVKSGKIKLDIPMGSANELKKGDWDKWKLPNIDYVVSNKADGVSCRLYYENGKLIKAMSRGNGYEGQDITRHILKIKNIKKQLPLNIDIKIRGEIIVPKNKIQTMLDEIELETGKRPKNQRNSVSGFINSKNGVEAVSNNVDFIAYRIEEWNKSEFEMFEYLGNDLNIQTVPYRLISGSTSEDELIKLLKDAKEKYEYPIDGLIITQNFTQLGYEGYETNSIKRKSSRKFKVGSSENSAITEVIDIEWNISKDGLFKPVIQIKPVELDGVTITQATGHNYKNIVDNKIGKGAVIEIIRSGLVVPWVKEVIKPSESEDYNIPDYRLWNIDSVDIKFNRISITEDDYDLDCLIDFYLTEQNIKKLVYFCSCLDVEQAGDGNIRKLLPEFKPYSYNIRNLILESEEKFINNIGVNGGIFYNSLHQKLNNCTECRFFDAVNCFGRGIGETKLDKVYSKYHTLSVSIEQLLNTNGFAEKSSEQYFEHLSNYFEWCEWLKNNNIKLKEPEIYNGVCNDLVVCFTGIRDSSMENFIKLNGGKIASSVTKECNLLICDSLNSTSGKMKKAKDKQIDIIDYDEACRRFF